MKRWPSAAASVALVVAAVIVYHNALSAYFFDDDFQWLVSSRSFHPSQLVAFGTLSHFYRPVIDLYFAAATPLFGGSPVLFHLANIVLHAANGLVVFALARLISRSTLYGFLAALFFVVQPSNIEAIAWVGALAEPIGVLFGCAALLFFLKWSTGGKARWRYLSVLSFLLALLTHESSVVFLPVLALADWAFVQRVQKDPLYPTPHVPRPQKDPPYATPQRRPGPFGPGWPDIARTYAPYVVSTLAYLAIDLVVNSRNYVVSQGYYAVGPHLVRNALDYLNALYVGKHDLLNDAVIAAGVVLLLWRGTRRVRFATAWMLLSLGPFIFFTWGNTSRYLYQPSIGFSMLLAEGVLYLESALTSRVPARARAAILAVAVAAITLRFGAFATANVASFTERTQAYRRFLAEFREIHGDIPSYTVVTPDPRLELRVPVQFVNAAVQWDYRDPTIQIEPSTRAR